MSVRSPLLGYNHNLKYKGRVYHIQTEDSGETNPHIFTHLFHSGTIIATNKTEYKHLLGKEDYEEEVRQMMQVQHKDMMKNLLKGTYDDKILRYFGGFTDEGEEEQEEKPSGVVPLDPLGAQFSSDPKAAPKAPKPAPPKPPVPQVPTGGVPAAAVQPRRPQRAVVAQDSGDAPQKHQGTVIAQLPVIPGIPAFGGGPGQFTKPQGGTMPGHSKRGMGGDEPGDFDSQDTNLDDMDWITEGAPVAEETPPPQGVIVAAPPPPPPTGGVIVSRPAIILTGENPGFGTFSTQKPKQQSSLIESSGVYGDDEDDEFRPDTNQRSSQHFYTRSEGFLEENTLTERPSRLTGPIQAPPGLFKPDSSKEIPSNIISLDDVDTKVDDIILDFLRMESTSKDDDDQ